VKSPDEIKRAFELIRPVYDKRNRQYMLNWLAYFGDFERISWYESRESGLTDNRRRRDQRAQSWNLLKPIVDTTILQLARLPGVSVPSPEPGVEAAAARATLIERAIYAYHDTSNMQAVQGEMAFSLGCWGSSVEQTVFDAELQIPRFQYRLPGDTYPMPRGRSGLFEWVIFSWQEDVETLRSRYPEVDGIIPRKGGRINASTVDILEYMDNDSHGIVINGKKAALAVMGYKDDRGFCPVTVTPAITLPGPNNIFGPADIDQLIAINMVLNSLQTQTFDAVQENLYPNIVTIGPEDVYLNKGPGEHTHMPEGSSIQVVPPPTIPDSVWVQLSRTVDFMRTHANWSEAWSGQSGASVQTGRAITQLQAPAAGMAGVRQGNMANNLQRHNTWFLKMLEHYFPNKEVELKSDGALTMQSAPGKPMGYTVKITPKTHIAGYYLNTVYYSPFGTDLMSSLSAIQQLSASDLVPRSWSRMMIPGVWDEEGMRLEIDRQKREDLELELSLQLKMEESKLEMQMKLAEHQQKLQMQMMAAQQGGVPGGLPGGPPGGAAPPPGGAPGMPGMPAPGVSMLPSGGPQAMGIGEPLSGQENFPLPYTNIKPFNQALDSLLGAGGNTPPGTPPAPAAPSAPSVGAGSEAPTQVADNPRIVTMEQVASAIEGIGDRISEGKIRSRSGGLAGKVYALGELATKRSTAGNIELGVTVARDQQLIVSTLVEWRGRLKITVIKPGGLPKTAVLITEGGSSGNQPEESVPEASANTIH